jgi:hypothetical protein
MHGNQAASPVASGDYEGAGCCVLVHARACAPTRVLGSWPVVESGSVPGRPKNLGQDRWRPALSHLSFSAAYSSGAVRRAPPCHRVVTEQPLSPTNKRLTIPVVRVPLLVDRAIRTTTRSTARRIRPWAVGRRFSPTLRLPVAGSPRINHEASSSVPGCRQVLRVTPTAGMVGSRTRCIRPPTLDQSC